MEYDLHLGDCIEYMRTLSDGVVLVTDTPYGIDGGRGGNARKYGKGKYQSDLWEDTEDYIELVVIPRIEMALSKSVRGAVTPGVRCLQMYPKPADIGCFWTPASVGRGPWGFVTFNPILYYGRDFRAGRGPLPSGRKVTERAEQNGHPCPKPIDAWKWLIGKVSLPGETVLDPFMGSGTTGVACMEMGRNFVGIELDASSYAIAERRIADAARQARGEFKRITDNATHEDLPLFMAD